MTLLKKWFNANKPSQKKKLILNKILQKSQAWYQEIEAKSESFKINLQILLHQKK